MAFNLLNFARRDDIKSKIDTKEIENILEQINLPEGEKNDLLNFFKHNNDTSHLSHFNKLQEIFLQLLKDNVAMQNVSKSLQQDKQRLILDTTEQEERKYQEAISFYRSLMSKHEKRMEQIRTDDVELLQSV